MENQLNLVDNATKVNQANIFENVISIEKLEERLETEYTCPNIMEF